MNPARTFSRIRLTLTAVMIVFVVLPVRSVDVGLIAGASQDLAGVAVRLTTVSAQAATVPAASHPGTPATSQATSASDAESSSEPVASLPASTVSQAEREVLLDLRARRIIIDTRERALASREIAIAAAERDLSQRSEQISALKIRLEQLDGARRERESADWRSLAKVYETMKPRDAAAIMNDMDMPVLLALLDRMKEAKTAQILAAMVPARARLATTRLAQLRVNPDVLPGTAASAVKLPEPPQ